MFDGVLVDSRETRKDGTQEILKYLQQLDVPAESKRLQVGDYQLYDRDGELVLITRKAADLTQSIFSGHFSDELSRCVATIQSYGGGKLFWLIEGPWSTANGQRGLAHYRKSGDAWFRQQLTSNASYKILPALQVSVQTAGAFVVATNSVYESAVAIKSIWERAREGWPTKIMAGIPRPTLRWHKDETGRVARLMALWPHLREEVAVGLLKHYGSIGAILDAARHSPKDILSFKGIGKQGLANLLRVIDNPTQSSLN